MLCSCTILELTDITRSYLFIFNSRLRIRRSILIVLLFSGRYWWWHVTCTLGIGMSLRIFNEAFAVIIGNELRVWLINIIFNSLTNTGVLHKNDVWYFHGYKSVKLSCSLILLIISCIHVPWDRLTCGRLMCVLIKQSARGRHFQISSGSKGIIIYDSCEALGVGGSSVIIAPVLNHGKITDHFMLAGHSRGVRVLCLS